MDRKEPPSSSTGKLKFFPKVPKRKPPSQPQRKAAAAADDNDAEFELQNNNIPMLDANKKKSSGDVAFGGRAEASAPTILHETVDEPNSDEEPYKEPWNKDTNYPTTLPMRRPHSGDPGMLDEDEFGQAASNKELDEMNVSAAKKLGLLDATKQESMILFQFPEGLLPKLAEGHTGKLLQYKSGKVKLKIGEILHDVTPGAGDICEQAVVIDVEDKNFCVLGQIKQRAVVSIDVNSILDGGTENEGKNIESAD